MGHGGHELTTAHCSMDSDVELLSDLFMQRRDSPEAHLQRRLNQYTVLVSPKYGSHKKLILFLYDGEFIIVTRKKG